MHTDDDNFPDVIGTPTELEREAQLSAGEVAHLVFPNAKEDPTGWKIIRHLCLAPYLGLTWIGENLDLMTEGEKREALRVIKNTRSLFYKLWKLKNEQDPGI